jgi:hypothetical protein
MKMKLDRNNKFIAFINWSLNINNVTYKLILLLLSKYSYLQAVKIDVQINTKYILNWMCNFVYELNEVYLINKQIL